MSLRERIAAGSRDALAEAFVSFRPLVLKVLKKRRRLPADFDDLIQNAFLRLPDCARKAGAGTSLGGCVVTATVQACRGFDCRSATSEQTVARRKSRRRYMEPGELEAFPDTSLSPEEFAEMRQRTHHLSELVLRLPALERRLLIARELRGASVGQLATQLGLSPTSVSARTCAARRRLEKLAASSPLAEVFASMPKWGEGLGTSETSRRRRRHVQKPARGFMQEIQ